MSETNSLIQNKALTNHLDKLKTIYQKLNPNKEIKEISYLANLGKVINELENLLSIKNDLLL